MDTLHSGFVRSLKEAPTAPSLSTSTTTYSYEQMYDISARLAGTVRGACRDNPGCVAVLGSRSLAAHAGLLACSFLGATYLPLGPATPERQLRSILELARPDAVITCPGLKSRDSIPAASRIPVIDAETATREGPRLGLDELASGSPEPAYVLFTSGSTGTPKGVPITNECVKAFFGALVSRYSFAASDVFAQVIEPTFDVSFLPTLCAWQSGASIRVMSNRESIIGVSDLLARDRVTVWTSTPSLANLLRTRGVLSPSAFAGLRMSFFCGEPLVAETAATWQEAAPRSLLVNLYGPTEATVATFAYDWPGKTRQEEWINGIVPIGFPLPGTHAYLLGLDNEGNAMEGELCLSGRQVFSGYLNNPERTNAAFAVMPDSGDLCYRTGDRVRRLEDGCHVFLGRLDDQVKVLGHRLELGEIEAALRTLPGITDAAALAWPVVDGTAHGVLAFTVGTADERSARRRLMELLPAYAIPSRFISLDALPTNSSGKVDRKRLIGHLGSSTDR
jgi:amino acid adenylation domain-containing protein